MSENSILTIRKQGSNSRALLFPYVAQGLRPVSKGMAVDDDYQTNDSE
jgi:hypothetical protein